MKLGQKIIGLRSIKKLHYDLDKDLKYNEKILTRLKFSKKKIIQKLKNNNLNYYSEELSWHYHIFSGFNFTRPKILEIGTFVGNFTNYLSNIFPKGKIYTIDLNETDKNFVYSYDKRFIKNKSDFIKQRKKNLISKNINVIKGNSFHLLSLFKKNFFDIIWVDGDHLDPQVTLDVFSSYHLLKKGGVFCCDDVVLNLNDPVKNQTDVDKVLKYLKNQKMVETYYFVKRINKNNSFTKKYCSFSFKK